VKANIGEIIASTRASWAPDTAGPGTDVQERGKPHGQCAVTALLVHELIGGEILRCEIKDSRGVVYGSHYWNLVPGVGEIDLTREQFPRDYPLPRGEVVPRSRLTDGPRAVAAMTCERYAVLRERVRADIRANHDPEW